MWHVSNYGVDFENIKLFAVEKNISNRACVVSRETTYNGHGSCIDSHTCEISRWPLFS